MARPLRLEYPGAVYHVTARGNQRQEIFLDDTDRLNWLTLLAKTCERFNWICYAYCLMSNHYHLVLETPDGNLSKGMRQLNGVYTQNFNRRHLRVGHVFQGRYTSILVEKDNYLLELCRYVELNPVRAKMVKVAEKWPWSSFLAKIGRAPQPPWLFCEVILSYFAMNKVKARKSYGEFVNAGIQEPSIWGKLQNQIFLGDESFINRHQEFLSDPSDLSEIPSPQRNPPIKPLSFFKSEYPSSREAIAYAYLSGHYSMKEIGRYFGVHYSTVSRAVKRLESI